MHTLRLALRTTEYDEKILEKRFHALSHIHNVLVKHARDLMEILDKNAEYQALRKEYIGLPATEKDDEKETPAVRKRKKELSSQMSAIRTGTGLSEYDLQSYIKVSGKQFTKCLSSQQIQKEATHVWKGVEKVLFGDGKKLHFKKYENFNTVSGKSNLNGARFDKESFSVGWLGMVLPCRKPRSIKEKEYVEKTLSDDISYCDIERKMFPNGWHYYVILVLKGDAPRKITESGKGTMGIDPGTSTIAAVSDTKAVLQELAPDAGRYNRRIVKLQRHMDISKRISNPAKYNPDGTIKKENRDRWVFSGSYQKNRRKLRTLYRKKAAYIKQSHEELCNELILDSTEIIVEDMSYKSLQRKSKKTERSDTASEIRKPDGTIAEVHKYKRKKRFGRSLNSRAPAMFLQILERKCVLYGGRLLKAETKSFCASQYDHVSDTFIKVPLSQRQKEIGGSMVQRDLYSAWLLKNADNTLKHADRTKCMEGFERFLLMQNELIKTMKQNHITMKQCFGF